jgi:hypothetical protein
LKSVGGFSPPQAGRSNSPKILSSVLLPEPRANDNCASAPTAQNKAYIGEYTYILATFEVTLTNTAHDNQVGRLGAHYFFHYFYAHP